MIIIKHGDNPEPKRWKFVCRCGCEWVTDLETEIHNKYRGPSYPDVFASCRCPECDELVYSECHISSEEYDKIYEKAFNEKEELN